MPADEPTPAPTKEPTPAPEMPVAPAPTAEPEMPVAPEPTREPEMPVAPAPTAEPVDPTTPPVDDSTEIEADLLGCHHDNKDDRVLGDMMDSKDMTPAVSKDVYPYLSGGWGIPTVFIEYKPFRAVIACAVRSFITFVLLLVKVWACKTYRQRVVSTYSSDRLSLFLWAGPTKR